MLSRARISAYAAKSRWGAANDLDRILVGDRAELELWHHEPGSYARSRVSMIRRGNPERIVSVVRGCALAARRSHRQQHVVRFKDLVVFDCAPKMPVERSIFVPIRIGGRRYSTIKSIF
jgi:hypothetical protein